MERNEITPDALEDSKKTLQLILNVLDEKIKCNEKIESLIKQIKTVLQIS